MRIWSFIIWLLSIFAILGTLAAPVVLSAGAVAMAIEPMAQMDMATTPDDMSCCPDQKQSLPDCQKSYPLATVCVAKCVPGVTQREFALFRFDRGVNIDRYTDRMRDPALGAPPDRPPRA